MKPNINPEKLSGETVEESLEVLNSQFPVENLELHSDDLKLIQEGTGLDGMSWVSVFRNSEMDSGQAESWLGKQVVEPAIKAGKWVAIREEGNMDFAYQAGYMKKMTGEDGNFYAVPTAKLAKFVQSRFPSEDKGQE